MKRNILVMLGGVVVLGINAFGQSKSFEDLTLSVKVMKPQVLQMEPIPLTITVANNTDTTVKDVSICLSFAGGGITMEVRNPEGKVIKPNQLSLLNRRNFCNMLKQDIAPGDKRVTSELYGFEHYKYFAVAGEYQVRVSLWGDTQIHSDWINLSVTRPAGMENDAYEFLLKTMEANSDFRPFTTWTTKDGKDITEEFVLNYPATAYADYVRYFLARNFFEKQKVKSENYFRAISKDFVYADKVDQSLKMLEGNKKHN